MCSQNVPCLHNLHILRLNMRNMHLPQCRLSSYTLCFVYMRFVKTHHLFKKHASCFSKRTISIFCTTRLLFTAWHIIAFSHNVLKRTHFALCRNTPWIKNTYHTFQNAQYQLSAPHTFFLELATSLHFPEINKRYFFPIDTSFPLRSHSMCCPQNILCANNLYIVCLNALTCTFRNADLLFSIYAKFA